MAENHRSLFLFFICCVLSFLVVVPETRNALIALKNSEERVVLSTLDYLGSSEKFKVIKLRVGTDIVLEIYQQNPTGSEILVQQFFLPFSRDTYFSTASLPSNLFLANLDDDLDDEIIAPIIDENLVYYFSIIKYDRASNSFQHFQTAEL